MVAFTCRLCGMTSYHPKDEEQGYCSACHAFTGQPKVETGNASERGEELKAHQLVYKTVYILEKRGRPAVTMWYDGKALGIYHGFYAGVTKVTLLLREQRDGTLVDDSHTQVHVYRYLGKV